MDAASGHYLTHNNHGTNGYCWSSSLNESDDSYAHNLNFNSSNANVNNNNVDNGRPLRLVTVSRNPPLPALFGFFFIHRASPPTHMHQPMNIEKIEKNDTYYELYADLLRAYHRAAKNKRSSSNRLAFELKREEHLAELTASILQRRYSPSASTRFIVTEPVVREVIAADFKDRVVHHYVDEYLTPWLERLLIHDCYSCRKGKGTGAGVERLEHHIRSCSRNFTKPCYVLKLDIQSYFMNINRQILSRKMERTMRRIGRQTNPENGLPNNKTERFHLVAYLVQMIIANDPLEGCVYRGDPCLLHRLPVAKSLAGSPTGCGLPIGNLTSQLFSNLYLNDFDHFMKKTLRLKHYGRYVDDFYIVHPDPDYLKGLVPVVSRFLRDDTALTLHPGKVKLLNARTGVGFLGSFIKPFRRYVLRSTAARIRRKVMRLGALPPEAYMADVKRMRAALSSANSFIGVFRRARAFNLRREVFRGSVMFRFCHTTAFLGKFVIHRCLKQRKPLQA